MFVQLRPADVRETLTNPDSEAVGNGLYFDQSADRPHASAMSQRSGSGATDTRINTDCLAKTGKRKKASEHLRLETFAFTGAGERNRTLDLLITSELLYQLSYSGIFLTFHLICLSGNSIIGYFRSVLFNDAKFRPGGWRVFRIVRISGAGHWPHGSTRRFLNAWCWHR